jgi:magnesium-transporting ATPase (P-type)
MSENDIRYYEGLDEEAIIALQNDMIISYNEENKLDKTNNQFSFRDLILENEFINRIFPTHTHEKPGVDLYNVGVIIQFLIVTYLLFFFSQMTGENEELSETFKFKRFRAEMIIFMFIQILLLLLDRYFYISNTFDSEKKEQKSQEIQTDTEESQEEEEEEEEKKRPSIITNLLVSENKHNFIKLMVYVMLVIFVHATVIWYFPITGNFKISEQIYCDANGPCNDLSENVFLWGFYILYMAYF